MPEVEIRKVQRLGASSLIVTIPHSWARRVGLKPGDSIMIVHEGDSLRLTPILKNPGSTSLTLDLNELRDERSLNYVMPCLYILGYDEFRVKIKSRDQINIFRNAISKLPGLELISLGEDSITAKVIVDLDKVDVRTLIKSMALITHNSINVLSRALKGESWESLELEIRSLAEELYRIRSLVERKLHTTSLSAGGSEELTSAGAILVLSALTLLSLINTLILDTMDILKGRLKTDSNLSLLASRLGELIPALGSIVVNPSVKRALELLESLSGLRGDLVKLIEVGELSGFNYIVATRLMDIIKILQIICYATLCVGLHAGVERR